MEEDARADELMASPTALSLSPSQEAESLVLACQSTPTSPVKGSTLLQRQVSRALEMIELYDGAAASASAGAMSAVQQRTLEGGAAVAHRPSRSLKAVAKKVPKAVFQISPNAIKRKRSHSMSSITSGTQLLGRLCPSLRVCPCAQSIG